MLIAFEKKNLLIAVFTSKKKILRLAVAAKQKLLIGFVS
jgi:hypothetical protein